MLQTPAHTLLLLLTIIGFATQASCSQALVDTQDELLESEDETLPPDLLRTDYLGTWNWLRSCGGFVPLCFTPASEDNTMELHLEQEGAFAVYSSDTLVAGGQFSIEPDGGRELIHYETESRSWPRRHYIALHGLDTLELDDGCCDQYVHFFIREPEE